MAGRVVGRGVLDAMIYIYINIISASNLNARLLVLRNIENTDRRMQANELRQTHVRCT